MVAAFHRYKSDASPMVKEALVNSICLMLEIHAQIVLCPTMNDGSALERTVHDLAGLHPGVVSAAIVPLGVSQLHSERERLTPATDAWCAEVIDQGRPGLEAYVILEGTASVTIGGQQVNEVGPGDIVGEMALIDHRPRSATVTATSPMRLLAFDAQRFRRLLDEMPEALIRVMERLIERKKNNTSDW